MEFCLFDCLAFLVPFAIQGSVFFAFLFLFLLFFAEIMVDSVIELGVVVDLILHVDLTNTWCKLDHSLLLHHLFELIEEFVVSLDMTLG